MYSPLVTIKKRYLELIHQKDRPPSREVLFLLLIGISFLFWCAVKIKDILYKEKILKPYRCNKKIISVGNITWGGTGKTSLVLSLHQKLQEYMKTCILTKGYAKDEYELLRRSTKSVYDGRDRVKMVEELKDTYDLFLLDDGFQYRSLGRDLDIVMIHKQDIITQPRLIPAGPLREPFSSLKRADIIVVSYCSKEELVPLRQKIFRMNRNAVVCAAHYKVTGLLDHTLNRVSAGYLEGKKIGVLTAIGYPQGFLEKVRQIQYGPQKVFIYPDHYEFKGKDLQEIEQRFLDEQIRDVLITYKDYYHIDFSRRKLNYFIVGVELVIEDQERFLEALYSRIKT